jgi:hypothetical protein
MIAWLQQFHELHLDKSRLESSYDEVGNAFMATQRAASCRFSATRVQHCPHGRPDAGPLVLRV